MRNPINTMIKTARRERLRKIRRWRKFRDACDKATTEDQVKARLQTIPGFKDLEIYDSWTTRIWMTTENGTFYADQVFTIDALKMIAKDVYTDAVS